MAVRPKLNKIVPDISKASIYVRSQRKWGKSSLFRDMIVEKYNDPEKGLLICCGHETGATMLDDINVVEVPN